MASMLKLTTDKHEASRGFTATAEFLVYAASTTNFLRCRKSITDVTLTSDTLSLAARPERTMSSLGKKS